MRWKWGRGGKRENSTDISFFLAQHFLSFVLARPLLLHPFDVIILDDVDLQLSRALMMCYLYASVIKW